MALDPSFDFIKSVAGLLDKYYLGARYPSGLPGGVPAEAFDGYDSARALEIARDVQRFVGDKLVVPSTVLPEHASCLPPSQVSNSYQGERESGQAPSGLMEHAHHGTALRR